MGTWALDDFRDLLAGAFAGRGLDNTRFDRWINAAKREVESSMQFEAGRLRAFITTVADQRAYALPDDFISFLSLIDRTNERALVKTEVENIELRERDKTGKPIYWARVGNELIINPTPDDAYEIEATAITESGDLVAGSDVTVIPTYWDNAIYFLAVHYGFMELGVDDKAKAWHDRATSYMRSRMRDEDWEQTTLTEPVRIVRNLDDLRRR